MVSEKFINECKNRSNANRYGKIVIDSTEEQISNSNNLQNFSIDDGCYIDGNIIGSVYIKKLTGNFIAVPEDIELIDKNIQAQIGVKYADGASEYMNMGNYIVERPKDEKTANFSQITAYDLLMNKIDELYVCGIDYEEGNITVRDVYIDLCNQLGLTPKTLEFLNDDIPVEANPFTNGEKNRLVLQTIAKVSCSFVVIDNDTNEIDLSWLSENEQPDYTFELSDYASLEGTKITFGPVNTVIIKNSQIDDENATEIDEESVSENGEHSIVISEDYILHNAELRALAMPKIFERLNGLKYVDCKLTTYYGKPFLKIGNKVRIKIDSSQYIDTFVLLHKFEYDGTFKSVVESPVKTGIEIKTKQDVKLPTILKNTQIDINKQKQIIESLAQKTEDNASQLSKVTQEVDKIQNLFQITGGNNLIKDSQLLLGDDVWEYVETDISDYIGGYDAELIGVTSSTGKIGIKNGKMSTNSSNITNLIIGSQYTLSYKISNDNNTTTTVRLIGNNTVYEKEFLEEISFQEEVFSFVATTSTYILEIESSTILDGYTYIYDLMLNKGDKSTWEPASGEIVSTVLKLSQLGLQIYCTGSEIATLMTSQGFQIRRFSNGNLYEIVTEFTKDGYISKKGVLEELEISSYDFKVIEYQGYETLVLYKKEGE